jgi:hypothetical protein
MSSGTASSQAKPCLGRAAQAGHQARARMDRGLCCVGGTFFMAWTSPFASSTSSSRCAEGSLQVALYMCPPIPPFPLLLCIPLQVPI